MPDEHGAIVGVSRPTVSVSARVFSGPNGTGELLADLGEIAGGELDHAEKKTQKKVRATKLAVWQARKDLYQAAKAGAEKDEIAGIKFVLRGLEQEASDAKKEHRLAEQALKVEKDELAKKLRFLKERREGANHG